MSTRRKFITLLGGATVAWPVPARAQDIQRVRRIGMLQTLAADDPEGHTRNAAFFRELERLGWADGLNVRIDLRSAAGHPDSIRNYATELVALAPDLIIALGSATVPPLQQATTTVPLIFVNVPDPVGAGFIESLARPGGNTTGFTMFEYAISSKWLELLKEVAPNVKRAAVVRDASIASGIGQWGAIQSVAPSLGVELIPINAREVTTIDRAVAAFAREPNRGLIVTGGPLSVIHREALVEIAARYKLPAVYFLRSFITAGGLICYGPDLIDQYRRAAGYAARILKGEKPADLPVQAPTKYELVINLKTAKALGLEVPLTLLARADEVIE